MAWNNNTLFFTVQLFGLAINFCECQLSLPSHGDSPKYPHTFSNFFLAKFCLDISKFQFRYHFVKETFPDSTSYDEVPLSCSHSIHFLTTFLIALIFSLVTLWILWGWVLCFVHHCILATLSQIFKKFVFVLSCIELIENSICGSIAKKIWPNCFRKCWWSI